MLPVGGATQLAEQCLVFLSQSTLVQFKIILISQGNARQFLLPVGGAVANEQLYTADRNSVLMAQQNLISL